MTGSVDPLRSPARPQVGGAVLSMEPVRPSSLRNLRPAEGGRRRPLSLSPAPAGTARLGPVCSPALARTPSPPSGKGRRSGRAQRPPHVSLTEAGLGQGGFAVQEAASAFRWEVCGATRRGTRMPSVTSGGVARTSVPVPRVAVPSRPRPGRHASEVTRPAPRSAGRGLRARDSARNHRNSTRFILK